MMSAKLLTLMANLSICYASCISSEVRQIYNPTHQATYSPSYSPPSTIDPPRLLIIGDVHGMRTELDALLKKAEFSQERGDRVIFAGDMINKGPDSAAVIELAMQINATSVRGNHEDNVLRTWAGANVARTLTVGSESEKAKAVENYEASLTTKELDALKTARTLSAEQRRWSANLPLVLRLGDLPGFGDVAVVHGGMAPGIKVEDQESWALYNVRSVVYPDENVKFGSEEEEKGFHVSTISKLSDRRPGRIPTEEDVEAEKERVLEYYQSADTPAIPIDTNEGRWWVEAWNEVEKAKPESERLTLIYGHDSKRGIQIYDYSKGLDSRCVDGGSLTAMILEPEDDVCDDGDEEPLLTSRLVSVEC
jgi:hypothetical protein